MPKDSLLGLAKDMPMDDMDMEDDEGGDDAKAEAGNALASAIKRGDGKAICEAVKTIMDLEYEE